MPKKKYKFPSGIRLVSYTIKKFNIELIKQIGENKSMSTFEIRELIDKFVKANYYTPEVVKTEKEAYYNNNTNKF